MQEFVNTDNKLLIRKCCWVESVSCKKHFSEPDVCSECSVHSPPVQQLAVDAESVKTTDVKLSSESSLEVEDNAGDRISTKKLSLTFEVSVKNSTVVTNDVDKSQKQNLQEAFLQFRQKKQDEARQQKQLDEARYGIPRTPARMEELRDKIIAQAKKYFGVPYAKKYWPSHAPEYASPIFLDCCALVRQVIRDLHQELGFRLGPWNQAYMFDTLPVTLSKEQMKPGDLVFMSGVYVNPKSKRQLHNMVHVEIWLGEGEKTIGSRWNNGKVQVFDSYKFSPRSFSSEQYIFKSIDTWLMGTCRSYCPQHPWRLKKYKANSKSVFNVEDTRCDGKAIDGSGDSLHAKSISLQDVDHLDTSKSTRLSNTALEDDESNTALEDDESNIALEDDESNTALENDESNTAFENDESNTALEDDESNTALEDDESNTALEDDESNTALEDDKSNIALEDDEYNTPCFDEALPAKTSSKSNSKACLYGTGSRYTFNSPKGWTFNRSSTIIPFKNSTVHFHIKRDTEPINTVQCHDGQSIHTAKQKLDFESYVMKIRSRNQCLESTILPDFRIDIFHNFAMDVLQEYLSKNMIIMIFSNFKIDNETKSEGISVKLPKWSSQDESIPNCWKTPKIEASFIQSAEVDSGIHKDYKITTWHESRPLSSISATVNSTNRFQPKPKCWQGQQSYLANTTLVTKTWPGQERNLTILGDNTFIVDICEDIGELKGNSYDKKQQDGNSEMGYDASDCSRRTAKLSAKADDSLEKSSCHPDSDEVQYLNCISEQDLTCIPTLCVNSINTLYRQRESPSLTSSLRCKSRNLSSVKELYKHMTSRKSNARYLSSRMRWLIKILALRGRYITTNRHTRSTRKLSSLPSRIRGKARNLPSRIRGVLKTRLTSRMIGRTRTLSHTTLYSSKYVLRFLVNQCEWSRLVLSELPKGCDKHEANKDQNGLDADTKQLVDLTLDSGKLSEVNSSWEFFVAIEQRLDALGSVQTQLQKADTFKDPSISATCNVYLGKLPSLEDGEVAPGVISAVLHSNKLLSNTKNDIHLHDLSFPLDNCCLTGTQHNACPDFKGIHCDQSMSEQMQQFSIDSCGNMNNNSSKDWCSDLTDAGETDSDKMCQVKLTSEFKRMSNVLPQNIHKHVQMRSDISMQKTVGSDPSDIHPSWLKDAHRSTTADTVYLSTHEKQRGLTLKATEGVDLLANDPVRIQCPQADNDTLESANDMFQEIVDANRHVAQFVLNHLPQPAGYADSCDSGSQSHSKGIQSLSSTDCTHDCSTNVTEDTVSICQSQDTNKDLDRVDNTECSRATSEDKTSDIRSGPNVPGPQNVTEGQGNIDFDSYSFCSVYNLNEFSNAHPIRISDEFRHYLSQDTTSNDGGDDDDIDDNQMDEDDELKYYDAEKQTSRGLLQSFVRSHNDDVGNDDENYDDFYGSMKETSDFSGTVCHVDHKSSLFPGGGEQPQKFKISVGAEEGNKQEQGESHNEQTGANGFLAVNIQREGGSGDACKDNEIGGICRRDSRPYSLTQCCLPNNMQPTFFIGGANGIHLVEGPLLALGWRRTADRFDDRFKLKWVENKSRINYLTFREGEQLVNHIPNCGLLTNKLGLLCSLQDYERITLITKGRLPRMRMADFVPETYKLDDKVDREKFIQEYRDGETWICKPTGMSQGKGIFLLRSQEKVDQLLGDRDPKLNPKCSRAPLMRIVQRYISHPLLLEGRKFDIRCYMFIASTVPFLVLYHKGYVRLSCNKYSPEDNNLTTHLTNQFVQKKDPAYKVVKEDTAWTMDKLNDYINEHVAQEKGLEQDWVYGKLTKQMQQITLHCFNSVKHKLQCRMGYFDLYGLDFMVDSDMKVWLIEINANPALHTNCQALKDAIPSVVEEAIYLALECFEKSCKGQPLMPLNSLGGYSVLYCGSSPHTAAHRQIRSVSPFKDITIWSRSSGTTVLSRQSQSHSLPRIETDNKQSDQLKCACSKFKEKQARLHHKLSTIINIGMTLEHETSTSDENNLYMQKIKKYPSSHSQKRQRQPVKQSAQTDFLSEV